MNIKKCETDSDFEAVFPLIRELRPHLAFEEYLSLIMEARKRDDYEIVAILDESKYIAAMGFRILFDFVHGKHLYVDDLVVTESFRSKGLGAELLRYAERVAVEKGCKGLRLCTGVDNKDGRRFYERNEIKDTLAYLRLIINPHDDVSFRRVVNTPPRGIGKTVMDALDQTDVSAAPADDPPLMAAGNWMPVCRALPATDPHARVSASGNWSMRLPKAIRVAIMASFQSTSAA